MTGGRQAGTACCEHPAPRCHSLDCYTALRPWLPGFCTAWPTLSARHRPVVVSQGSSDRRLLHRQPSPGTCQSPLSFHPHRGLLRPRSRMMQGDDGVFSIIVRSRPPASSSTAPGLWTSSGLPFCSRLHLPRPAMQQHPHGGGVVVPRRQERCVEAMQHHGAAWQRRGAARVPPGAAVVRPGVLLR